MDTIIRLSLRHRALVLTAAVVLCVAGVRAVLDMPVDVFPDLTAPTVTVMTEVPGMAAEEVERLVTFPIETGLNGSPGVRRLRSSSAVGVSVVWVEFDWGFDVRVARQTVNEKLLLVADDLPPEADTPVMAPLSSIMGEIAFLGLTSDHDDPIALRTYADGVVRRRLLSVPGVSQVTPIGGDEKQLQVLLDPVEMTAHRTALHEVADALRDANTNTSAGFLQEGGTEAVVRGLGRLRTTDDIAGTAVRVDGGAPLLVAELGRVAAGPAPRRGTGSLNGRPAVILGVQKQPGANTLEVTERLDAVLRELEAELPKDMTLHGRLFRQADFVTAAVSNVAHALRDGALLVVLVMIVFLANVRATLITLTALPLSILGAVLALRAFGAGIDTMTLGGLAIAVGALVDDAVIDVENVVRRLRLNRVLPAEQRRPSLAVVRDATLEIRGSIVFATLIIMLVFLPLFFLSGVEGRLLVPLGLAYVTALAASLLTASTVTPALCALLLPGSRAVVQDKEGALARRLRALYAPVLDRVLDHPWRTSLPAAAALAAAVVLLLGAGRAFLPEFHEGALTISAVTLPGTNLEESDKLGRALEEILLRHPEVVSTARRTGRAELDQHAMSVESSEIDVTLREGERPYDEFLDALRADLAVLPGLSITIGQPLGHRIDHMLSGSRAEVAVKIFGDDLTELRRLAARARDAMADVPGVVDLAVEPQTLIPTLEVDLDRAALARHGLSVDRVNAVLEAAFDGLTVTQVRDAVQAYDVVVKLESPDGLAADRVGDVPVMLDSGGTVPLRTLARIEKRRGPNFVNREQVQRKIVVTCNTAGRDVASVVDDVRRRVDPVVAAAPGARVEYGGQFESAQSAGRTLLLLTALVIVGIGLLLQTAFGSTRDALLVMLNLPLALLGGVGGVLWSDNVLSLASLIGFITVFGVAARNGIMLVSHIRHLQLAEGVTDLREAVRRGALERLSPILMTALASGLALVPLALAGAEAGSELETPMARVILCGLLSSMVLNMVITPALYLRLGRPARVEGDER
ncbi:MAG TPA: efflux RND transporter permease subunit [Candidatus Krumholzibacteria bacterium]|nr:efflux RND transporter permease subunit [Candidatus Krumholzibacteria bacterium]HRX52306.1 efflux RND transporter permease subunit [Candidatus Krumholzibacteria bacterium]